MLFRSTDGDGLALRANWALGKYQENVGQVLRTDSVPRTTAKPAEHLIAVVLGTPELLEAVQAKFVLVERKGIGIIHSHRVYGSHVGPQMSEWLKAHGPSLENVLMQWDTTTPALVGLLQEAGRK